MLRPKAIFYCGANGSGKSTLRSFSDDNVNVIIDSDRIAAQIGKGLLGDNDVKLVAGKTAINLFNQCIDSKTAFSLETTLSGFSSIARIQKARKSGFEIIIKYIGLKDSDLNILRVEERVRSGGHDIPPSIIKRRYISSRDNLITAFPLADYVYVYDNSSKEIKWQLYEENNLIYLSQEYEVWIDNLRSELLSLGFKQSNEYL